MTSIQERLFAMQDDGYRNFHMALIPTVESRRIIGVRVPMLRKLARELYHTAEGEQFLRALPHVYYEENNLHAFLLERISDYTDCLAQVNAFLPYVDNWATCDSLSPKCFRKRLTEEKICFWLGSEHPYTVRFGMKMLMTWYLDDAFTPAHLQWVASAETEEYYVKMMAAWYYATALAKQYETVLAYLKENQLPVWTHNKTIQKATESCRISPEQKAELRLLRR